MRDKICGNTCKSGVSDSAFLKFICKFGFYALILRPIFSGNDCRFAIGRYFTLER